MSDINTAILERLERVVDSLQENSVKMGQLLAVHNEKLDKQDKVDIRKIDERLRIMEKKMWTIFGGLTVISFLLSAPGQRVMRQLTGSQSTSMMGTEIIRSIG